MLLAHSFASLISLGDCFTKDTVKISNVQGIKQFHGQARSIDLYKLRKEMRDVPRIMSGAGQQSQLFQLWLNPARFSHSPVVRSNSVLMFKEPPTAVSFKRSE